VKLLDMFGDELEVGDLVIMDEGTKMIRWQIQEISPSADPKQHPSTLKVTFTAVMQKPFMGSMPTSIARVMESEKRAERDAAQAQRPKIIQPN